jgi:hypothetical protein
MTDVHSTQFNKDDLIGELLADELEEEGQGGGTDVAALKAEVEKLTAANAGLLQAKQAEKQKRQETAERLSGLEGTLNGILSQRQQAGMESVSESQAAEAQRRGLPVEYDADGNGWIDMNALGQELLSPYEQKLMELDNKINMLNGRTQAVDEAERVRQALIGSDERFDAAGRKYRAARQWLEDRTAEHARRQGRRHAYSSGEVLDQVVDADVAAAFKEQFGDIDVYDIVTAEDSKVSFQRMLNNVANVLTPSDVETSPAQKMDSRFQQVLQKPSTLGNQANAKAGELSIYDKVNNLTTQDIMDLDDKTVEALMRAAGKE